MNIPHISESISAGADKLFAAGIELRRVNIVTVKENASFRSARIDQRDPLIEAFGQRDKILIRMERSRFQKGGASNRNGPGVPGMQINQVRLPIPMTCQNNFAVVAEFHVTNHSRK